MFAQFAALVIRSAGNGGARIQFHLPPPGEQFFVVAQEDEPLQPVFGKGMEWGVAQVNVCDQAAEIGISRRGLDQAKGTFIIAAQFSPDYWPDPMAGAIVDKIPQPVQVVDVGEADRIITEFFCPPAQGVTGCRGLEQRVMGVQAQGDRCICPRQSFSRPNSSCILSIVLFSALFFRLF